MSDLALEVSGSTLSISHGQQAISNRPQHLDRDVIRNAILQSPDCGLILVEDGFFFIVGLGNNPQVQFSRKGIHTARGTAYFPMSFYTLKALLEQTHGWFVQVPPTGYSLAHTIGWSDDGQSLVVATHIPELIEPPYEVTPKEKQGLEQMSEAICRVAWLAPENLDVAIQT